MGVVYMCIMITCNKSSYASVIYIFETGKMLRIRLNCHLHSLNTADNTKPFGAHFLQARHSMKNLQFSILMCNLSNTDKRKMFELNYNTIDKFINIMHAYIYSIFIISYTYIYNSLYIIFT